MSLSTQGGKFSLWSSDLPQELLILYIYIYIFLTCFAGEEETNRDAGESEMDIQAEKTKHPAVGPEEWDGPSKKNLHVVVVDSLVRRQISPLP